MPDADPYGFVANHLMSGQMAAIRDFWADFTRQADGIDAYFTRTTTVSSVDPVEFMLALRQLSPDLMWEFGPGSRGHNLCITAEVVYELRPLARALRNMAPDLPRWTFSDAREPVTPEAFGAEFTGRFGRLPALTQVQTTIGPDNRINLAGRGPDDIESVRDTTLKAALMLLGEQADRDWFGFVDAKSDKQGPFARWRRQAAQPFDPVSFVEAFDDTVAAVVRSLPDRPVARRDIDNDPVTLFNVSTPATASFRPDLITFTAPSAAYANAALGAAPFSSATQSKFGEWFMFLRVPFGPFADSADVDVRHQIESQLHTLLSAAQLGGFVAGGHGRDAVYIDFAVTDVAKALRLLANALAVQSMMEVATFHFLDAGLGAYVIPVSTVSTMLTQH